MFQYSDFKLPNLAKNVRKMDSFNDISFFSTIQIFSSLKTGIKRGSPCPFILFEKTGASFETSTFLARKRYQNRY